MSKQEIQLYAVLLCIWILFIGCKEQSNNNELSNTITSTIGNVESAASSDAPKAIVRSLIQDKSGTIWIAAFDGVFSYDGTKFTNVTEDVTSARFFSALEDKNGNLWFGTVGWGVFVISKGSIENFTIKDGLINNEVLALYEDKAGNVWLGANGGVTRYDGKTFKNYLFKVDTIVEEKSGKSLPDVRPPNEVTSMIEDRNGRIWIATRGNTFIYGKDGVAIFKNKEYAFQNVRTLLEDRGGNIWFGGNDGLWRYDGSKFTQLSQSFGGFVYEDSGGNIWTSSQADDGWALSRYDQKSLLDEMPKATHIRSREKMIFGILEARDGSLWFGTTHGVSRYDGKVVTDL